MVGGTKEKLLTENFWATVSSEMTKFRLTSAAPGIGIPGARGLKRGWRFVSSIGLVDATCGVVGSGVMGSKMGAAIYLRIAELIPPSKPVLPLLGLARIQ